MTTTTLDTITDADTNLDTQETLPKAPLPILDIIESTKYTCSTVCSCGQSHVCNNTMPCDSHDWGCYR